MSKVSKFLENFWFYNKWKVMAFIVIAVSVVLCVSQCASRERTDYTVVLFTYSEFADEQLDKMSSYLEKHAKDLNGDGDVVVGFNNCSYDRTTSTDQIRKARISKLQSSIIAESDQIIYITDKDSFKFLNTLFDDAELFVNLGLPDDNGKSYVLKDDFYDYTKGNDITLKKGIRVSIRTCGGIENVGNSKELSEDLKNSVDLMESLTNQTLKYAE